MIYALLVLGSPSPPDYVDFTQGVTDPKAIGFFGLAFKPRSRIVLDLPNRMEAQYFVSHDRRHIVVASSPKQPPLMPQEGYTVMDQRAATDTAETSLYRWDGNRYALVRNFGKIGFSMEGSWNRQSTKLALRMVKGLMTVDPVPPHTLGVIDAENGKYQVLNQTEDYENAASSPLWNSNGNKLLVTLASGSSRERKALITVATKSCVPYSTSRNLSRTKDFNASSFPCKSEKDWLAKESVFLSSGMVFVKQVNAKNQIQFAIASQQSGKIAWRKVLPIANYWFFVNQGAWVRLPENDNAYHFTNWRTGKQVRFLAN